jgi:hypothetical protein
MTKLITIAYDPDDNFDDDGEPLDLLAYLLNELDNRKITTRIRECSTTDALVAAIEDQGLAVLATRKIADIAEANEVDEDTVREHLPQIRQAIANSSAPDSFDTVCFNILTRPDEARLKP